MKLKIIFYSVVAVLIVAQILLLQHTSSLRKQRDRLEENQAALMSSVEFYRTDSLESAASIVQLRLTAEELENSNIALQNEVDNLNIKIKRLNAVSAVGTKSEYIVKTVIKDSIIYRDSIVFVAPCINYNTPYVSLEGCIIDSTNFEGTIETRDSLIRIEHRVPKRFLGIPLRSTKLVKEEYVSKNPHTTITNVETVVIVNKEGKRKDR